MQDCNVLNPIGFDAFGLPRRKLCHQEPHPSRHRHAAEHQELHPSAQMLGYGFDWDRVIDTTDPQYYKWTQWIFPPAVQARPYLQDDDARQRWCTSCRSACWPTKRGRRGRVCERCARPLSARKRASGCCASRSMPTASSTISTMSTTSSAYEDTAAQLDRLPLHRYRSRSRPTSRMISPFTPPVSILCSA